MWKWGLHNCSFQWWWQYTVSDLAKPSQKNVEQWSYLGAFKWYLSLNLTLFIPNLTLVLVLILIYGHFVSIKWHLKSQIGGTLGNSALNYTLICINLWQRHKTHVYITWTVLRQYNSLTCLWTRAVTIFINHWLVLKTLLTPTSCCCLLQWVFSLANFR